MACVFSAVALGGGSAGAQLICDASVAIGDVTVTEGTGGTRTATFTVTRTGECLENMVVDYGTANGTAVAPTDYTAVTGGRITFTPTGSDSQTIPITVQSDAADEPDETFRVELTATSAGSISDPSGTGTITDDDAAPTVSAVDRSFAEGDAGEQAGDLEVRLSAASGRTVTVEYATAPGTATSPADFTAAAGTLTFDPGTTTRTVPIAVKGDRLDEPSENFNLQLSNPQNASAGTNATATIDDDDPLPAASLTDATISEGHTGTKSVDLTVSLTNPSASVVAADFASLAGSAEPGDFVATSGRLEFMPGQTERTVTLVVNGDTRHEGDETVHVDLSNAANGTIADSRGTVTITDDDPEPQISIDDVTVAEGDTGTRPATFTVRLTNPGDNPIGVSYATANGTAVEPTDYSQRSGTLSFAAGETERTVSVDVQGDMPDEDDEHFFVDLASPSNATISDSRGRATITDNDPLPTLAVGDVTVTEGDTGTKTATFNVALSPTSGRQVSVRYATADAGASDGPDYTGVSGILTFAPGDTQKAVDVVVKGDTLDEPDEEVLLNLTDQANANVGDGQGVGRIVDNDDPPVLSIADVTVVEGTGAGSTQAAFTVSLSAASGRTVTSSYATAPGTATSPADFTAIPSTAVSFAPGETQKTVSVGVARDSLDEVDESFSVQLAPPQNATAGTSVGIGTITDDDAAPAISLNDVTVTEPDTGETVQANLTASLSGPSGKAITVPYATEDFTAIAGSDFTGASGQLTIPAGQASGTISIVVKGDLLDEDDQEAFFVDLSETPDATLADAEGRVTILDDDPLPALSVADAVIAEGAQGQTATATVSVSLGAASGRTVTADYSIAAGTASAGSDFTAGSGTLTFAPGETQKTVTVSVAGDSLDEDDETVRVTLTSQSNAALADGEGILTITDDDLPPVLSVDDVSVTETNDDTARASFVLRLSGPSGRALSIRYRTSDGSATAPGDYGALPLTTLTFAAGETQKTVHVQIAGDRVDEDDAETFFLDLSNPVNVSAPDLRAQATIVDDEGLPRLSVADVTLAEGPAGATAAAVFTVQISEASGRNVGVAYSTAAGTASAGADYTTVSGTLVFAPGEVQKTVSVPVIGDALDEIDETFALNLENPSNAAFADAAATGTITDDDAPPSVSVGSITAAEGSAGFTQLNFPVTLSAPSGQVVSVTYATAPGSATAPDDFTAIPATILGFQPGETQKTISVQVAGDTLDEVDETFTVELSSPDRATPGNMTGTGTISDDDVPPALSVDDVTVTEPDTGESVQASFTVSLSSVSGKAVTFTYATRDGSARAPGDYAAIGGQFTIPAGQRSANVPVSVRGDLLDEENEDLFLDVGPASEATIGDGTGRAVVNDDDPEPALTIADVTVAEGAAGATANADVTVSLSAASGRPVTVGYAVTAGTATADEDFTSRSGTLTFPAGETSKTIAVPVKGDDLDEHDETVLVGLSAASNATIADAQGVLTITDDDVEPSLSIADVTVTEGNTGTTPANFVLTLSKPSGRSLQVTYATSDGSARAPSDYAAAPPTVLTFAAGETQKVVPVAVNADVADEPDVETFSLDLSAARFVSLPDTRGEGRITDDDGPPSLSVADVSIAEGTGTESPRAASFTVTLSPAAGRTVLVDYATAQGTATAGADYGSTSGTLAFAEGETQKSVSVPIIGDALDEPDEEFLLNLSNAPEAAIGDAQAVGRITDDDDQPSVSVGSVTDVEGNAGSTQFNFPITLSAPSGRTVKVTYATAPGTATPPADFTAIPSTTMTFQPGETQKNVAVQVAGDALDEDTENFSVQLSAPENAAAGSMVGIGTITDDDATPSFSVNDPVVTEPDTNQSAQAQFTVSLSAASGRPVTLSYSTREMTAVAGRDYTAASGQISIPAGQTQASVPVEVLGDLLNEFDETFALDVSPVANAVPGDDSGTATIDDDDPEPALSVTDAEVTEGNLNPRTITFTVNLSAVSGRTVTASFGTSPDTATPGADYLTASGALSLAPGETQKTVSVQVEPDVLDEADETFALNLSSPAGATLGDALGVGTIRDNDEPPVLAIDDVTVQEGNAGTANATFTLELSAPSGRTVFVDRRTTDGTAVAPGDYTASTRGTVSLPAGTTKTQVSVAVAGDTVDEDDVETFFLDLSNPQNVTVSDSRGVASIVDDDAAPAVSIADAEVTEAGPGTTAQAMFAVSLSNASARQVSVRYDTLDGTATSPADYTASGGTATIAPGSLSTTIQVPVAGDLLDEDAETFETRLSAPVNATLADDRGTATITDDDNPAGLSISDVTVPEGNAGTRTAEFTVTLAPASGKTVEVNWATANIDATAGSDYDAASGSLTFAPGETSKAVAVTVRGDELDEMDTERFAVDLTAPRNAVLTDGQGIGSITDDDPLPTLSVGDVRLQAEGAQGDSQPATFTFTLSRPSGRTVQVDYATAPGSAGPADFDSAAGRLTFLPGETQKSVSVTVRGDDRDERDETFEMRLSAPVDVVLERPAATATIVDDDATPGLAVSDESVGESGAGPVAAVLAVTLSAASGNEVRVDYATQNRSATAGSDYTGATGTLVFAPGETRKTVAVGVLDDALDEDDESFELKLSAATDATIADGTGVATIVDDDPLPALSIDDGAAAEGTGGTNRQQLAVRLSVPAGREVRVRYATQDGTAKAPGDYAESTGTLVFAPGDTQEAVPVDVATDALDEDDAESLTVTLSQPVAATVADGTATLTITDDDNRPEIRIDDPVTDEGAPGETRTMAFAVTLSAPSGRAVGVAYAGAPGSATPASDFTAVSPGTLTFAPGETAKTVPVQLIGDDRDEPDETLLIELSQAQHASLPDTQGVGTIRDDDDAPSVSIGNRTKDEGTGSAATAFTFDLTLSRPSGRTVSVPYATAPGTAATNADFAPGQGAVTFAPGEVARTVTVQVTADALDEDDENFSVQLSPPEHATLATAVGIGTISDDDAPPVATVNDRTVNEGGAGQVQAVPFTVSLDRPSGRAVSIGYATADFTAVSPGDYAAAGGQVTIPAGQTSGTIPIQVNGDDLDELDVESFDVRLTGAVDATLPPDESGTASIVDDDALPALAVSDPVVTEGDTGVAQASFTVSLSAPSGREVTVAYATRNGTAHSGADYAAVSSGATPLSFSQGQTQKTVQVPVHGDLLDEDDETFLLELSAATAATIADAQGNATIVDDDPLPSLSVGDVTIDPETNAGTVEATFRIALSRPSGREVTVAYETADGTATAPDDYTSTSGTLRFAPGEVQKDVTVVVKGETLHEADETFRLVLSQASRATILDAEATALIRNDDAQPRVSVNDALVGEGDTGTAAMTFTLSLTNPSSSAITVGWSTADFGATAPADYVAASGTVTIPAGQPSATVKVDVKGDLLDEADEQVRLDLANPSGAAPGDLEGLGTIVDDDPTPSLSIADVTTEEGDASTRVANHLVTLSAPAGREVRVAYTTRDGSAIRGKDYEARSGELVFAPGETEKTITVPVIGDALNEDASETYTVELSAPASAPMNATLAKALGQGTITDNDPLPVLSVADVTVSEGDTGTSAANFTVRLSAPSGRTVTVGFQTSDVTASAPADYITHNATLTFAPGQTDVVVPVTIVGERLREGNETFRVRILDPTKASIAGTGLATGTIVDDDPIPAVSLGNDLTVAEGDTGSANATFGVGLTNPSATPITVDVATQDVSAESPSDYTAVATTQLTFSPGETQKTVPVTVKGDTVDEPDQENFRVLLSNVSPSGTLDDAQAIGTITDDDAAPAISVDDVTVQENGTAELRVRLSHQSSRTVSLEYATSDGTALAGADYDARSGGLSFLPATNSSPGETERRVAVPIRQDQLNEDDETLALRLAAPANAVLSDAEAIATIDDDDPLPTLSIADVTVAEGDSGGHNAQFSATLSAPSGRPVRATFETFDGTATSSGDFTTDYVAARGTVTFAPGETAKAIFVEIRGDMLDDPEDDTFSVRLSAPVAADLDRASATGHIVDDDATPAVSIDGTVTNLEDVDPVLHVRLAARSGRRVTVGYRTVDDTARAPRDYSAATGTVTFEPGETDHTVTLDVTSDDVDEEDELLYVDLTDPVATSVGAPARAAVRILDDDNPPGVAAGDARVQEGTGGSTTVSVPVTLSNPSARSVAVAYEVRDGTAQAGSDYTTGQASGTLVFAEGETAKAIEVTVSGDTVHEPGEENLHVVLTGATGGANITDGSGTVTIVDDDGQPSLVVHDLRVEPEGTGAARSAAVTIALSASSSRETRVAYATEDGTARAPGDYTAASGVASIPAGRRSATVPIEIQADTEVEGTETFSIQLDNASGAVMGDARAQIVIVDDDVAAPPSPPTPEQPLEPAPVTPPAPVAAANVRRSSSGAMVDVTCDGSQRASRCRGRIQLVLPATRKSAKAKPGPVIGSRKFSVKRGASATLSVKLNKTGRRLLARKKKLRVLVILVVARRDPVQVAKLTVKAARRTKQPARARRRAARRSTAPGDRPVTPAAR